MRLSTVVAALAIALVGAAENPFGYHIIEYDDDKCEGKLISVSSGVDEVMLDSRTKYFRVRTNGPGWWIGHPYSCDCKDCLWQYPHVERYMSEAEAKRQGFADARTFNREKQGADTCFTRQNAIWNKDVQCLRLGGT